MTLHLRGTPDAAGVEPAGLLPASRRVRALSADARLLARLRERGLHGSVHSVFDRVLNFTTADGELFTLAGHGLDDAPNTARLALAGFGDTGVRVGDAVLATGSRLWVGSRLCASFDGVQAWQCRLPAYPDRCGRLRVNVSWCAQRLEQHAAGRRGAMGPFDSAAMQLLHQRAAGVLQAMEQQDPALATLHAKSLIGLGPGLTPSGDDFLLGLFAVLHLPGSPCEGWLQGGAQVLAGAAHGTNAISLAALQCAAQGRVRESIASLLEQLLHGDGNPLEAALERVLAIGANSGADIAAGLVGGLQLQLFHGKQAS
jgi:hypothetical protein